MFKKKPKQCPESTPSLDRAKDISDQYKQLSSCCDVIAEAKCNKHMDLLYSGGWKMSAYVIGAAGIDIEEVYAHIIKLAQKRKLELELELEKLDS
jgi:hypothetical protein